MAEAAHAAAEQTVQEYINHHLSFLTFGKVDGHWGFAHTPEEAMEMGFWAVNVDTLGWSIFLGAAFLLFFSGPLVKERQLTLLLEYRILSRLFSNLSMPAFQKDLIIKMI